MIVHLGASTEFCFLLRWASMCLEVCCLADVFRCVKIMFFLILKIFFSSEQMPAVIKMIQNLEVPNSKAVAAFVKTYCRLSCEHYVLRTSKWNQSILCSVVFLESKKRISSDIKCRIKVMLIHQSKTVTYDTIQYTSLSPTSQKST